MSRLTVSILAMGLAAAVGTASAQSGYYPQGQYPQGQYQNGTQPTVDRYGQSYGAQYDYARVIRVDPVSQSGYYGTSSNGQQNCRSNSTYAGNDPYYDRDGYTSNDGYYGNSRNDGYYGNDPYYPQQQRDGYGSTAGRTVATVLGTVLGAAIGSQVGGGSARYATSAIGSMVGGMAGRQVYETTQRNRQPARVGTVQVCDPVPVRDNYGNGYSNAGYSNTGYGQQSNRVTAYDVTYEYGGRRYTSRTNYHPGDRIRVRVDVRPE